ncbi:hypothetical protein Pcinc_039935 [Petrolisthes cinctipes]|uniref:Uncharacterized protein n=1 Tax=Petrolisthes cinctipes TaxID=88211 RepID=A0AAE1BNR9_PETCI|nr:hypothetical protein Pcinc_039935 [Petrolisthes cinctipes]
MSSTGNGQLLVALTPWAHTSPVTPMTSQGQVVGAGARGGVPGGRGVQGGAVGASGPDTPLSRSGGGGRPDVTHGCVGALGNPIA